MKLVDVRRVSTAEQAKGDKTGLARQATSNRRRANELGAELLGDPVVVTNVSRVNFVHTSAWQRLKEVIRDQDVHVVVDEFGRFVAGYNGIEILRECRRTNTTIYTNTGSIAREKFS